VPPKRQPRRVAAWIYVVINPIIESLQREVSLLEMGNLTWRAYSRRCEIIKAIQEYVDSSQWPNYQDFLAEHPKSVFIPGFKQHDSHVDSLNNAAQALFSRLLSWPAFRGLLQTSIASYENRRESLGPTARPLSDMGGGIEEEVAQHLINNAQELPRHYVISVFWNSEARARLSSLKSDATFRPLLQASGNLLKHSGRLKLALENHRLSLSRDYDVPAAQVPGVSLEA
jgi:hypothetical protein